MLVQTERHSHERFTTAPVIRPRTRALHNSARYSSSKSPHAAAFQLQAIRSPDIALADVVVGRAIDLLHLVIYPLQNRLRSTLPCNTNELFPSFLLLPSSPQALEYISRTFEYQEEKTKKRLSEVYRCFQNILSLHVLNRYTQKGRC
jgi:hypothetical protein